MAHVAFHNTTPLYGDALIAAVTAAERQDEAVLAIFSGGGRWSPSKVWEYGRACGRSWLLGSVRRSISTLTKAGHLRITGMTVPGLYGRPENTWVLESKP